MIELSCNVYDLMVIDTLQAAIVQKMGLGGGAGGRILFHKDFSVTHQMN